MSFLRAVCISCPQPTVPARDVLDVCHGFPTRKSQSGISGKLVCLGEQFLLMLEGERKSVELLIKRIQNEVPAADMKIKSRQAADERAFSSWTIQDTYLDEIGQDDPAAAELFADTCIDLLAGVADKQSDPFALLARLSEGNTSIPSRVLVTAQATASDLASDESQDNKQSIAA